MRRLQSVSLGVLLWKGVVRNIHRQGCGEGGIDNRVCLTRGLITTVVATRAANCLKCELLLSSHAMPVTVTPAFETSGSPPAAPPCCPIENGKYVCIKLELPRGQGRGRVQ